MYARIKQGYTKNEKATCFRTCVTKGGIISFESISYKVKVLYTFMDREEKWPKSANIVSTPKENKHSRRIKNIIFDEVYDKQKIK